MLEEKSFVSAEDRTPVVQSVVITAGKVRDIAFTTGYSTVTALHIKLLPSDKTGEDLDRFLLYIPVTVA
jgi:hypothetical protein